MISSPRCFFLTLFSSGFFLWPGLLSGVVTEVGKVLFALICVTLTSLSGSTNFGFTMFNVATVELNPSLVFLIFGAHNGKTLLESVPFFLSDDSCLLKCVLTTLSIRVLSCSTPRKGTHLCVYFQGNFTISAIIVGTFRFFLPKGTFFSHTCTCL